MTLQEINALIEWCRRKMQNKSCGGKRGEGYDEAMLAMMSHLSSMKKEVSK